MLIFVMQQLELAGSRKWSNYNRALIARGEITFWFSEDQAGQWEASPSHRQGRPQKFADTAIECVLMIRAFFKLPLRATQGFVASLLRLHQLDLPTPHYTTLCRRAGKLSVRIPRLPTSSESIHVVIDSTGLKVYGEGEWKVRQHGWSKRRTWRKLHVALNPFTGEALCAELTENSISDDAMLPGMLEQIPDPIGQVSADGAYDKESCHIAIESREARPAIPPRRNAKIRIHGNRLGREHPRDTNLRLIRRHGRAKWKREMDYHQRSLAETFMRRYKATLGNTLRSRTLPNQRTEASIGVALLNRLNLNPKFRAA